MAGQSSQFCGACLTRGRLLRPMGDLSEIYRVLTLPYSNNQLYNTTIQVCWECAAQLQRASDLQERLMNAGVLIHSVNSMDQKTDYSLSRLKNQYKLGEDYFVQNGVILKSTDLTLINVESSSSLVKINDDVTPTEAATRPSTRTFRWANMKNDDIWIKDENPDALFLYSSQSDEEIISPKKSKKRSKHSVKLHHKQEDNAHKCSICDKIFVTNRALRYHRECAHKSPQKCQYCGMEFNNRGTLKRHLLLHTGMPMYECSVCHKNYRGTHGLNAHMRTHENGPAEESFCIECDIQFKNKYLYRQHLKTSQAHASKESYRFACTLCEKRFFVPSQLRAHEDIVHLKKKDFKCPTCKKEFSTPYKLKSHVRKVHDKCVEKKHICETCARAFATKQQLDRHQPVHTGVRAFVCGLCGANFRQAAALYTHKKVLHRKQIQ